MVKTGEDGSNWCAASTRTSWEKLIMGLMTAQSGCLGWDKILAKEKHEPILGGTGRNQAGGMRES